MIDTVLNLLFRCPHRHLTRPVTPVSKAGEPHGQTYVVCLECGKQFEYDVKQMRIGKPVDHSPYDGVVPPNMPNPRKTKVKFALAAAVPVAVLLGAFLKSQKSAPKQDAAKPEAKPDAAMPQAEPDTVKPEPKPDAAKPEAKMDTAEPEPKPGAAMPEVKPEEH